jgi:hypothetical protein
MCLNDISYTYQWADNFQSKMAAARTILVSWREHAAAIARSGRGDGGDPMLRGGKRF